MGGELDRERLWSLRSRQRIDDHDVDQEWVSAFVAASSGDRANRRPSRRRCFAISRRKSSAALQECRLVVAELLGDFPDERLNAELNTGKLA